MKYEDAVVWASGHHLTDQLPPEWVNWDDETLFSFISEHLWEPFQDYDAPSVFEFIAQMAESVVKLIKEEAM